MKVKLTTAVDSFIHGVFPTGHTFTVRPESSNYLVIEGVLKGYILSKEFCEIVKEPKLYTEKEWNDLENYYLSLLDLADEKNDRLTQTVHHLTQIINKKNEERTVTVSVQLDGQTILTHLFQELKNG